MSYQLSYVLVTVVYKATLSVGTTAACIHRRPLRAIDVEVGAARTGGVYQIGICSSGPNEPGLPGMDG